MLDVKNKTKNVILFSGNCRKRSKLDRNPKQPNSIDENVHPQSIMQEGNDLAAASTSKDGATPIASIANGSILIKHGMVPIMDGLNDSSLMNVTDNSINEQPADVDLTLPTTTPVVTNESMVRKSKRSHNKTDFFMSDNYTGPPPDGRAIVNTSLIKVATQNQHRGRSPLTNVANNRNGSSVEVEAQQKRNMAVIAENGFHLYQKKNPQTYFGEGLT